MKNRHLYAAWGILYVLCALYALAPREELGPLVALLSLGFFVPPGVLLYRGLKKGEAFPVKLVRRISLASLSLTVVGLVLNFLSVRWSEAAGTVLHGLLALVSVPMLSGIWWAVSIFCWAFLLIASLPRKK